MKSGNIFVNIKEMNNIQFYKGKGSQKKCFEANPGGFYVCLQQPYQKRTPSGDVVKYTNTYASFDNIQQFFKFQKQWEGENCFYETLKGEIVEVYDIDGYYTNSIFQDDHGKPLQDEDIINNFIEARTDFSDDCEDIPKVFKKDFYILKTGGGIERKKASFHIIIRNEYKYENTRALREITKKFQKYISENNYKTTFDPAIYSSNRLIRCIDSHKAGEPERILERYDGWNSENQFCKKELFFASHLVGNEELWSPPPEEKEPPRDPEDKSLCFEGENFDNLLNLILEIVNKGSHSLCDNEYPTKMCYDNWYKLVYTVFNNIDEKDCYHYFCELFPYYRHAEEEKKMEMFANMKNYKETYTQLTQRSLHYWARENNKYGIVFPEALQKFQSIKRLRNWKRELKKSEKKYGAGGEPSYPVKYIHQIRNLHEMSYDVPMKLEYIEAVVNSIIHRIINGGEQLFICKDDYYCDLAKKRLEKYTITKYTNLEKVGGACNITVRVIDEEYEKKLEIWEAQMALLITSGAAKKEITKLEREKPVPYYTAKLAGVKPLTLIIMDEMLTENRFSTFSRIVNDPYLYPKENKHNEFNLFQGFPYLKELMDGKLESHEWIKSPLRNHLRQTLCNGDDESFDYVESFFAHMIQKPDENADVMLLFFGAQGTGKDLFMSFISSIIGSVLYLDVSQIGELFSRFNDNQAGKLLMRINEITDKGIHFDKHGQLKSIITQHHITVEPKNKPKFSLKSTSRLVGFGNPSASGDSLVNIENTDRRFAIFKTNDEVANNQAYFTPLYELSQEESLIKSAFHYFATLPITGYNPRQIPENKARKEQKKNNLASPLEWILDEFDGTEKDNLDNFTSDLYNDYRVWMMQEGRERFIPIRKTFKNTLLQFGLVEQRIVMKNKYNDKDQIKKGFRINKKKTEILFKKYLKDETFTFEKLKGVYQEKIKIKG